jgi:signal transduction histidine kinase
VRDTGPGIAPEVLARLFEPNFSTKTDGMGLGLTLVRSTIEQLGGTLTLESAPGEGTSVRINLPLLAP